MSAKSDVLELIEKHGLMIRPSLTGNWIAGIWKGVSCHTPGKAYCEIDSEVERSTLSQAVIDCIGKNKKDGN